MEHLSNYVLFALCVVVPVLAVGAMVYSAVTAPKGDEKPGIGFVRTPERGSPEDVRG